MPKESANAFSNSLERALVILEMVGHAQGGLTNSAISRELGIATSSCSYILTRLERKGFLTRNAETGRYCVGLAVLALAQGVLREMGFRSLAEPTLYWLVDKTGLSASIGVLQGGRILLVDRLESPNSVAEANRVPRWDRIHSVSARGKIRRLGLRDIGQELPAHSNALGKAVLAHMPRQQVIKVVSEFGLSRSTPYTIVSLEKLFEELEQVKRQGYAVAKEEQHIGIYAIAAPIFDRSSNVLAAVSIAGAPADPAWDEMHELVQLVREAGRKISNNA